MTPPNPTSGQFEGRAHLLPVRVYYEDTDFTGLVYHGAYVRWFERGRSDFLRCADVSHTELLEGDRPLGFAVVRLEIDYRRAARIDDALVVRTRFAAIKGPRLIAAQSIERDGETLASAHVEAACIDLAGRARRPPRLLQERLNPWLSGPSP